MLLALGRIDGLGGALGDVGGAVELRALAAVPQVAQADTVKLQLARHDRISAAHAREACRLGETAQFDGTTLGTGYLVDAVGDVVVLDEGFVGRIEEDEAALAQGVVHPLLQLVAAEHGARGVVGIAEVDEVDMLRGQGGHEMALGRDGEEANGAACGTARHDIAIDIDGIDRVGHGHTEAGVEDVGDIAAIALRTIADEYFVDVNLHAARCVVVVHDGLAQEGVALFGSVAAEGFGDSHFIDGAVHGCDAGRRQGARHIADAQADDVALGMGFAESLHAVGDGGEEIILL